MVSAVMSMIVPGRVEFGVVASSVDLVAGRTAGGTARGTAGETTAGADTLSLSDPYTVPTTYWHRLDDQIVLSSYGRSSGFCVDPVEKKPLNHFLPGSSVLSFGTAGCNLACRF